MKIALVRKAYTPYGGAERYLGQLIARLCDQGHEVHVFAHRWDADPKKEREGKRASTFHRVPMMPGPSFLEALSFAFFSERLLREESFDIIHSFERTLYQDIYRAGDGCHREWLIQRRRMDSTLKRISHRVNPLHLSLLYLEKKLFASPRLKKIIANSRKGKEEIIRHYGVPDDKIEVIYNGVDLKKFHPENISLYREPTRKELGLTPGSFVLLFLGSGFRRKGLDALLRAMPLVMKEAPEAYLLVAGKDSIPRYRKRAKILKVEERVLFLGPTAKANELYAASDLFALPTLYDPFSNASLEALATGIPVLTTRGNGVAELIEEGENGFVIEDPLDPQGIAAAALSFFRSSGKCFFGKRAREACANLGMETVVKRMMAIYEECIKK